MRSAEKLDITGKDWLTVDEAAHYCGVSVSQFKTRAQEYDLDPRDFMGKKLYEKSALYTAIYGARKWSRSQFTGATGSRISTGTMGTSATVSPSVAEALQKLRKSEQRKRRN